LLSSDNNNLILSGRFFLSTLVKIGHCEPISRDSNKGPHKNFFSGQSKVISPLGLGIVICFFSKSKTFFIVVRNFSSSTPRSSAVQSLITSCNFTFTNSFASICWFVCSNLLTSNLLEISECTALPNLSFLLSKYLAYQIRLRVFFSFLSFLIFCIISSLSHSDFASSLCFSSTSSCSFILSMSTEKDLSAFAMSVGLYLCFLKISFTYGGNPLNTSAMVSI
jgi:hypothetical protein